MLPLRALLGMPQNFVEVVAQTGYAYLLPH